MKIDIGPYTSDIIPVGRWERSYEIWRSGSFYLDEKDYTWYDKIILGSLDKLSDLVRPLNRWSNNRKRRIKIKYHNYDTWGLDNTLALIILPGLKQLKATNHGFAQVAEEDGPDHLRGPENDEERWNWVMDELIWAFTQIVEDYPVDFTSGTSDWVWTTTDLGLQRLDKGPNHTFTVDFDAQKQYNDRIDRALILFGKHYRNLWD